jgi:hypothetical protein
MPTGIHLDLLLISQPRSSSTCLLFPYPTPAFLSSKKGRGLAQVAQTVPGLAVTLADLLLLPTSTLDQAQERQWLDENLGKPKA